MTKKRLDRLLVDKGLVSSRNRAYSAIIAGEIKVNAQTCLKPDQLVDESDDIRYRPAELEYVSRGGLKLEKALDHFKVDVRGLVVLDSGASTGGFTDCLLRRGAAKVIAVDVGYGQLAWRLRTDSRVELHERVNLRYLVPDDISRLAHLATLDLSFISLTKVMGAVKNCLVEDGRILALVKPQFEAGKGLVKKGVIRDPGVHIEVLTEVGRKLVSEGLALAGMTWSPVLGAKGNIEYWFYLSKKPSVGYPIERIGGLAAEVTALAHGALGRE